MKGASNLTAMAGRMSASRMAPVETGLQSRPVLLPVPRGQEIPPTVFRI